MSFKNAILYTVLMFSICLNAGCGGETVVTKIRPTEHPGTQPNKGVIFSLPQTVVIAEVPLTRVASNPGIFANWTRLFYPALTADDFVTEQKSVFKVGTAKFDTRGQTDPDNLYIAHINAKQFETKTLLLEFNEDGIIARTDASSKDDTIDVVTSGIKTAAAIVAPLIGGGASLPAALDSSNDIGFLEAKIRSREQALGDIETAPEKKSVCEQKQIAASAARERASKAADKAKVSRKDNDKVAADQAQKAADDASSQADAFCNEAQFKLAMSEEDQLLYESLDDNYKAFLRENFGYQFLTYIAKRSLTDGSTGIHFFLTLSEKQQRFFDNLTRTASPCEKWPAASKNCLATEVKLELLRAKAAYDKILELRKKRQDTLFERTGTDVNTSSHLEFRLKELDAQIKNLEQTFFFGTSTETSGVAKFELTPGKGLVEEKQPLFSYSRGGTKPGVCSIDDKDEPGVFKAFVPEPLKGVCHAPGFLITSGDVRDTNAFVKRFKTAASRDSVSSYLFSQFRAQTQRMIDSSTDDDKPQARANLLNALFTDLTNVIEGASIYPTVVQHVKLSDATLKVQTDVTKLEAIPNPTQQQLAELTQLRRRLNRSLLDDTYAKELYRQSAWEPHAVALVIDPRTPGMATAVDEHDFVEKGKRGFPYRIAAVTTAKMLDDETEKGRSSLRIAQFGPVQSLPAKLGGRRSSYKITYFDSTGQIKVFDMSADALIQKDNVKDVTDAVTTLRDSEAAQLERDTKLLELKKKKLEAEKALKEAAKEEPSPTPEP